jgi:alkylation response protein AidB-like acyl-CoA dehydrogenase
MGKLEDKMGQRASDTAEVFLEDVHIPRQNLLGQEGRGFVIAMQTLDRARPSVAAAAVGLARAALEAAIAYSQERRQFGQSISSFQAIQFMLADMAIKTEAARLLARRAAWLADQGSRNSAEAAMAKCYATDTAMEVTTDTVQILGGYGYMKDHPVEKYMRDAKIMQIYEGTNQIQRAIVARALLR